MPVSTHSCPVADSDPSPDTGGSGSPRHLGIIMDGNGRWAKQRGLPRVEGHRRGLQALRNILKAMPSRGINCVTIYGFSAENWRRPESEIRDLMLLLRLFVRDDLEALAKAGVRVRIIGERDNLDSDIRALLEEAETRTAGNERLQLQVAFNYGGRQEIVRAVRALARDVAEGRFAWSDITSDVLTERLDTAGLPDPDLIIRTSGEQRLSNFLLWQAAYAEFVFLPCFWPDFTEEQLDLALAEFARRNRRFGGITEHRS